jgi:rhamnulokinase
MNDSYLAFDLGAESGRAILGTLGDDGRLRTRELHRFRNGPVETLGRLHWDVLGLWREILQGLRACSAAGCPSPRSVGVDTWGVDFGLLDERGGLLGTPMAYRDRRFPPAMESFLASFPRERLYELTGIQFLPFNSVFQLHALAREDGPALRQAASLLFMPDLFHAFLAGVRKTEATIASTTQMVNPRTGAWEPEIVRALGIRPEILPEIVPPGTVLGPLDPGVRAQTGFGPVPVVAVATHDTASAVAAVPAEGDDFAYLSSGTWSLLGIESREPVITEASREANLTNEGGIGGTFRVLRNLMGLWILQECRRAWSLDRAWSYAELAAAAEGAPPFRGFIDPDRPEFLHPGDMSAAVEGFLRATGQPVPGDAGGVTRCILESLALSYRHALESLRKATGRAIRRLHVIGGGSQNDLLCRFTANAAGIPVLAGPAEATAMGNLLVQAMASGAIGCLRELRAVVRASFPVKTYDPVQTDAWDAAYGRFLGLVQRAALPRTG